MRIGRQQREALNGHRGGVVYLTGLSGAGKSTLAGLLERRLHDLGVRTAVLDGDELRQGINRGLGFSDEDRIENARRVAEIARLMVDAGLVVIVALISPFRQARDDARAKFAPTDFMEVFVDAPLEVCEQRDPKGLYQRARRREILGFTGIDSRYEPPLAPELRLDTALMSAQQAVGALLVAMAAFGFAAPAQRRVLGASLVRTDLAHTQAAIVDLDGTMVDTLGDFDFALNAMLSDLGLDGVDRRFIEHTVGKGSEHLIRSTLAHVGAEGDVYEQAWARYQHHYLRINGDHSRVYPGVVEGLQMMRRRGWRLACLTNKPTAFAEALLQKKGLLGFFDVFFGGDAFERKKPDPLPLLKTCEALQTDPARTLMIGDSSNDARAARAAGCPVVLVSYGYNHGEPVCAVDSDGVLDRMDELGDAPVAPPLSADVDLRR